MHTVGVDETSGFKRSGDDLLSAQQVVDQFPEAGLTRAQLWRWARAGSFPVVRFPSGRMKFRRSDIEALLRPVTASAPSAGSAAVPPGAPGEVPGQRALWSASSPAGGGGRLVE